jgi:hypothetical protein
MSQKVAAHGNKIRFGEAGGTSDYGLTLPMWESNW